MSVTRSALFLTAVVLLAVGAYRYGLSTAPPTDDSAARATVDSLSARLVAYERLATVDSLLFAGDYRAVRAAAETDTLLAAHLRLRTAHLDELIRNRRALDTLRARRPRTDTVLLEQIVTTPQFLPAPSRPTDLRRIDSLNAALSEAEREIRRLAAKKPPTTTPEYFTFRTIAGNHVDYIGELRDGKANGRGAAILSTGSRYRGEWRDNKKHGRGTFHWTDGAYYEGQYEDDHRHGEGTYYFPDGSRYVGEWADDLRHGRGVYYNKKGKVIAEGVWAKDKLTEQR